MEGVIFGHELPCPRGVQRHGLASTVTQVAGISNFSGWDDSMGPGGHVKHLDLVVNTMLLA